MVKKSSKTSKTSKNTKTSTSVDETVASSTTTTPVEQTNSTTASVTKSTKSSKKTKSKTTKKTSAKTTKKASSKTTKKASSKTSKTKTATPSTSTTTTVDLSSSTTPTTTTTETDATSTPPTPPDPYMECMARINLAFSGLLSQLDAQRDSLRSVTAEVKRQQKVMLKEVRDLQKHSSKSKRRSKSNGKRKPSGFAKPGPITDELCEFLGKPVGTQMARTTVTTFLTDYIKKNNLQNPKNKKEILRDAALKKIISIEPGVKLTYFNLQHYMKPHYLTQSKSSSSAPVATV